MKNTEGQDNANISNAPTGAVFNPNDTLDNPPKTRLKNRFKLKSKPKFKSGMKTEKKLTKVLDWLLPRKKIVFIISGSLLTVLTILIVVSIIIKPGNPTEEIELDPQQERAVVAYMDVHPEASREDAIKAIMAPVESKDFNIADFNIETSDGYDGYMYLFNLFESKESSMYNGAITIDNKGEDTEEKIDVNIVLDNIRQIVEKNDITDERTLQLVEIEKAKFYIDSGASCNLGPAWEILSKIKEEDLLDSQILAYYAVMELYYYTIEDESKTAEYEAKYDKYLKEHH